MGVKFFLEAAFLGSTKRSAGSINVQNGEETTGEATGRCTGILQRGANFFDTAASDTNQQ
ncbi:MAG: hypothetical protein Q7R98_00885 [Candidatus Jorgensenbacteria bacterium]|nr:hypothetical protein [Candidatus Jorgensenbacteria bacterium]